MANDHPKRGKGNDPDADRAAEAATILDPRLTDLWAAMWADQDEAVPIGVVGGFLRLAYLTGYQDALTEEVRGGLFTSLGLPVPARTRAARPARRPSGRRASP